uniref:Gamma-butyrobetaine dioxygenase n=1 Tax=Cacopsylla melanoneura TaxID=428564 RepID=A0A8D8Q2K0_9HEMI
MNKIIQRFCSTSKRWSFEAPIIGTKNLTLQNLENPEKNAQFPYVWLRDNCQCSQCFNDTSKSRIIDLKTNLKTLPIDVEIVTDIDKSVDDNGEPKIKSLHDKFNNEVEATKMIANSVEENDEPSVTGDINRTYKVKIKWEDKHKSEYSLNWLLERTFTTNNRAKLDQVYKIRQIPWTSEQFEQICSRFNFSDVLNDERILLKWLECLSTYGVAIVTRAGVEIGALKQLASRVGFLKRTQYGETFRVEAKTGTSNVAYLSSKLQLHTDLPYYEYKPGLNMLHCLIQAEGNLQGINQLVDCLAVIHHLRTNQRSVFDILSKTIVDWSDYGEDSGYKFANIHRAPVICLDSRGEVSRVNFSQPQRDSVFNVTIEEVEPWYEAMAEFTRLLHDPKYLLEFKLSPGEILTFDNIRLVHGRLGYEGERLLEGGYLDWDLVRSRIRVLRSELNKNHE